MARDGSALGPRHLFTTATSLQQEIISVGCFPPLFTNPLKKGHITPFDL